jgi:hypothetical protein
VSRWAVLIGPFEGSRWYGGCGEFLWDLNGRSQLGQRALLVSARCRKHYGLRHDNPSSLSMLAPGSRSNRWSSDG